VNQFLDQEQIIIFEPDGCSVAQACDQIAGGQFSIIHFPLCCTPPMTRPSLLNVDGQLEHIDAGKRIRVNKDYYFQLVPKYVVTKRLVNRGTAENEHWECELCPYMPDERVVLALHTGRSSERSYPAQSLAGGALVDRVPKA